MPISVNGKLYTAVTLTGDKALETYDADITPENMQHGKTAYVKGKKITGTGKAFAVAGYGRGMVLPLRDTEGNEKYGLSIFTKTKPNIIFLASTTTGDIVLQADHIFELAENEAVTIGVNRTTSCDVKIFYKESFLNIYFENVEDIETRLIYFYGKDNEI